MKRILLCLLACSFVACVTVPKKGPAPPPVFSEKGDNFDDTEHGFQVFVPKGWQRQNLLDRGVVLLAPDSYTTNSKEGRPNFNILTDTLPQSPTTDEYFEALGRALAREPGYEVMRRGKMVIGGERFLWRIFTHVPGQMRFMTVQYAGVVNGRPFVISCSCLPAQYDTVKSEFDVIIKSIKFL